MNGLKGSRVVWPQTCRAELEPFTVRDPEANEVTIRTSLSLISPGTERAWLLGLPGTPNSFPMYPGYSSVGSVLAVGSAVENLKVGTRVLHDAPHATHATLSSNRVFPIPESLEEEAAVFARLGCIALQGVRKSFLELGESVVILGLGLVGLLTVQLARAAGGIPITGIDISAFRRNLATRAGADQVLPAGESIEVSEPKVVFDCTGSPEAVNTAMRIAGYRGRVVLLASTRGNTDAVDFYRDVHKKGLTVIGAHNQVRPQLESSPGFWTLREDVYTIFEMIRLARLVAADLISHRVGPNKVADVYRRLLEWDEQLMGAIIDWRDYSSPVSSPALS